MEFRADQFNYDAESRCFVAEASSLGLRPFEVPGHFALLNPSLEHRKIHFTFTNRDFSGGDIAGWRYWSGGDFKALIIND